MARRRNDRGNYGPNQRRNNQGRPSPRGYQQRGYQQDIDDYYDGEYERDEYRRRKRKKKKALFIVEIIILLILALGLFAWSKFSKLNRNEIKTGDIIINEQAKEATSGYTNIALFGVDSQEGQLEKDTRSDALMIASINNKTKEVKLVSVYRDTYLDNTNGEFRKATEAYYFGGPERSINMLNKNLDLNITDYVTVDFNVMAKVVDELGGVEINVEEDEIVHINNYQVGGSQITGMDYVPVTYAGPQTLNGLQALSYCRIRATAGNDFRRTERQRAVLSEMLNKAKSADLIRLNNVADEVIKEMSTSFSGAEILFLLKDILAYDMSENTGFPYNSMPVLDPVAGDCVVPVNLADNVAQLHQWLFRTENYTPSTTVQEITNTIINNTGIQ